MMGNVGPHAWNFVKLNGKVYNVDVTWDSCLIAGECPAMDYYFLRNDAVFSKSHLWDFVLYPPITEDYPRKERMVTSKWELEQYLCEKVNAGERDIVIQLADDFPGTEVLQRLIKAIVARNPLAFLQIKGHGSSYYDSIKYAKIHFE